MKSLTLRSAGVALLAFMASGMAVRQEHRLEHARRLAGEWGSLSVAAEMSELLEHEPPLEDADLRIAIVYFEALLRATFPQDRRDWTFLQEQANWATMRHQRRWTFFEEAASELLPALVEIGETERARDCGLHLLNVRDLGGFEFSEVRGASALLVLADVLLETGGFVAGREHRGEYRWFETPAEAVNAGYLRKAWRQSSESLALQLARDVLELGATSDLQARAQRLAESIPSRPGVQLSPAMLFFLAKRACEGGSDPEAIDACLRVFAALENADTLERLEYGPAAAFELGQVYERDGRLLEAALAFREARLTYDTRDMTEGRRSLRAGLAHLHACRRLLSKDLEVTAYRRLKSEANRFMSIKTDCRWGGPPRPVTPSELAFERRNYATALLEFVKTPRSSADYESAILRTAECIRNLGNEEEAQDWIVHYLDTFIADEQNAVSAARLEKREELEGRAAHTRCLYEFEAGRYELVIASSLDYALSASASTTHLRKVLKMVGVACERLGRTDQAKALLDTHKAQEPQAALERRRMTQAWREEQARLKEAKKER